MKKIDNNRRPYEQAYFPPIPNKTTRFMRTCFIWQVVRFIALNLKITKLLLKSH